MRQDLAVPILNQFHTWLEAQRAEALPRLAMLGVCGYSGLGRSRGMPVVAGRSIFREIKHLQGPGPQ